MTFDHVENAVVSHVQKIHESLGTQNEVKCYLAKKPGRPWKAETDTPNFQAAIKAVTDVWGVAPDLTREGGSIPSKSTLHFAGNCQFLQNFRPIFFILTILEF